MPRAKSPDSGAGKKKAPGTKSGTAASKSRKTNAEQNGAGFPASSDPVMNGALPVTANSYGPSEDEIRQRAYELYEQEGYQQGRHEDHWQRAAAELHERHRKGRH